jgi:hypothetical protein
MQSMKAMVAAPFSVTLTAQAHMVTPAMRSVGSACHDPVLEAMHGGRINDFETLFEGSVLTRKQQKHWKNTEPDAE